MTTPYDLLALGVVDIEFPLRTRAEDAEGATADASADPAAPGRPTAGAEPLRPPLPFLVERLLAAAAPFGMEVEIKSEQRVVGTWTLDVGQRGAADALVSQAQADLYVCASARADPRATGAFLVVRHWSVGSSDRRVLEQLYASLSVAALERLDSLLGGGASEGDPVRECVLYLVDARRSGGGFRLDRLQARLLEELEGELPIAGLDLRVAYGRGKGTRPHGLAATVPTPLTAESPGAAGPHTPPAPVLPLAEVFVPETVAPKNLRWNRRASDRARALAAAAEALREPDEAR